MAVSSDTLQLPSGTSVTKIINVPTAGAWLGGVAVSLVVAVNSTVTMQAIKYAIDGTPIVRTVWNNITLLANRRKYEFLKQGETVIKIIYTSTQELSFGIETNTAARVDA